MRHRGRQGFTLIEIVITLAIFAILTVIGFGLVRDMIPASRTRRAAQEFSTSVAACRAMAVQSHRQCRVLLVDYDPSPASAETANIGEYWIALGDEDRRSTTWDVLPVDEGGSDDTVGDGTVVLTKGSDDELPWVSMGNWQDYQTISGPGTGNANAIVFDPRGFVENPASDFSSNGYIEVPFLNKNAWVQGREEGMLVRIARSGLVRVISDTDPSLFSEGSAGTDASSGGSPASSGGGGGSGGDEGGPDTGWTSGGDSGGGGGEDTSFGGGEGGSGGGPSDSGFGGPSDSGFGGGGTGGGGGGPSDSGFGGPADSGFGGGGGPGGGGPGGGGGGGGGWDSGFPMPT